ncbi:hypothetical protein Egran_02105 [Elaphomyces granulatus]|uniref:DUF7924 domain-containing protein n=1 Tax=Elaphomyces granulatus TaxID=519963 RepID=A0A232M1A9_9EURO|nr:hypothetical protein Egran_02105 [Elaphomyces granulatus]
MLKNRDPSAPSDITDEQLQDIRQHPRILALRKKLKDEMRSLAGAMRNAREPFPELCSEHDEVDKELTRLRKIFEMRLRRKHERTISTPHQRCHPDELEPTNPRLYLCREGPAGAFYDPEAESFDEKLLLERRIQATKDLVAFAPAEGTRTYQSSNVLVMSMEMSRMRDPTLGRPKKLELIPPGAICYPPPQSAPEFHPDLSIVSWLKSVEDLEQLELDDQVTTSNMPISRHVWLDLGLENLEMGTGEPEVEDYFRDNVFPKLGPLDALKRIDKAPMAKTVVLDVGSTKFKLSTPVPDMFQSVQLRRMDNEMAANSQGLLYPFFSAEYEADGPGGSGSLWAATNQCIGSPTACVNIGERLNQRLRDKSVELNTAGFTIAMSGTEARLFVSWRDNDRRFYVQKVRSSALQEPEHFVQFHTHLFECYPRGDRKAASLTAKSRAQPWDENGSSSKRPRLEPSPESQERQSSGRRRSLQGRISLIRYVAACYASPCQHRPHHHRGQELRRRQSRTHPSSLGHRVCPARNVEACAVDSLSPTRLRTPDLIRAA